MDLTGAGINVVGDGMDVYKKIQDFQSPPVPSALIMVRDQEVEIKNATPEQILKMVREIEAKGGK